MNDAQIYIILYKMLSSCSKKILNNHNLDQNLPKTRWIKHMLEKKYVFVWKYENDKLSSPEWFWEIKTNISNLQCIFEKYFW